MNEPASQPTGVPSRTVTLLCTYNEVDNLPQLLAALERHLPHADVLVVDDNSPDGTAQWVQSQAEHESNAAEDITLEGPGAVNRAAEPQAATEIKASPRRQIHLLSRPGKFGLGTATRDGLQWCLERKYDFIINMDADLSHQAASTPALLAACEEAGADVGVGSRYIAGGGLEGLPWHRRLVSRMLNGYATRLLQLPVSDCSGSFRCYRATALKDLDLQSLKCPGYGFFEEILVALHRRGAKLVEVPIRFQARSGGHSKLALSDAVGAIRVIHRLAFDALFRSGRR